MDVPPVNLAELLRHPDDLDKIAALKAEFTRKKAAVDSQLRGGLREQLETTQSGMNGLADGQKTVQQIKEEMMKIDKICSESQNMITDFATINLVSQAHRNFGAVETMRRNLETFNDRLGDIDAMLRDDDEDQENMPNLLAIHYELTQLRNIRDDAIEQIQRGDDPSLQSTLEDYFERLDGAIKWFDEHIELIALSLINLVTTDNNSLVVRFALIIEAEEKSDQRVLALQEALKDHKEIATRFQSITDGAKTVRGYKERFLNTIRTSGEAKFEPTREEFLDDPTQLEKSLKWYFNDLNAVRLGMVPLMPKKWKIFKTWANIYHSLMHDFLVGLIDDPNTSSAHTLEIISWPEKYYRKMTKLGMRQDELVPHVIDNRETELVRDFRALIIKFLDEWIDRIFKQERKDFADRNVEGGNLDQDEYGYFRTKNLVDLWRMLREQVDAAANSQRADVIEGVIDAMFQRLRARQQAWQRMLEDEAARYETSKGDVELDGFQPLQDWLVATANDQIACIDDNEEEGRFAYLSDFKKKFAPLVTPQYMDRAEGDVAALRDGYVDLSTWCMTKFAGLVFAVDFKAVMPDFFTTKWYTSTAMARMIATLEEYVNDYRLVLHHSLVDIFTEIFTEELLVRYLMAVHNKGAKFRRTDAYQDKLFDDLSTAFEFFSSLPNPDVGNAIKETWRATEPFLQLLSCDKESVPDVFEQFKTSYWDLQISWVEAVLRARDDFERAMLNGVKARAAQMDVVRGPETIMSKVK
ncbi:exocyst complex component Sec6-domain-containing protein [Apodospora peruviana]|uniref:Exocyst complex component Sec6-domain-containing protein n=1 Tax=Apodospora peruviana TaxID=516989 RepID=A0AAE0HXD3_9PEZI|nr:exocyst complex component Sec6-domain-containing protein [Apodospora peruviana]